MNGAGPVRLLAIVGVIVLLTGFKQIENNVLLLLFEYAARHKIVIALMIVSSLVVAWLLIHLKGDTLRLASAIAWLPLVLILYSCLVW